MGGFMGTIHVKINLVNIFNQVVDFINNIANNECEECGEACETVKNCEACNEYPEVPREIQTMDIKFQIIKNITDEIAKRGAELNDEKIIELCERLGYEFTESNEGSTKENKP